MLARRKVKNDANIDEVDEAGENIDSKRVTRAMARGLRIDDESDEDDDDDYTDIDDDDDDDEMDYGGDKYYEVGKDEDHN